MSLHIGRVVFNLSIIRKGVSGALVWTLETETSQGNRAGAKCHAAAVTLRLAGQACWLSLDLSWKWMHRHQ